ncbi:MAG: bifunctional riboflavin kinase/FAD synthetase [Gammaproteobacteria bacterium]|nr:bifunctional riboflavin kinase/FAD synthetase [Gammaproteobacteria bacterium]
MELIRGLNNLRTRHRDCVLSIGNYDGVHFGHQAVVRQLLHKADDLAMPAMVLTFEPHPQEFFAGPSAPRRLSSLRDKLVVLGALGVHRVLCLRFGRQLAQMRARDFVVQILVEGLGVRHLVVGDDFRFGRRREGDFDFLVEQGGRQGFTVARTATYEVDGARVSSTRVRGALARADFAAAAALLGRPYQISGRVIRGDQRGRVWGFPTANLNIKRGTPPVSGTFAVSVAGVRERPVYGVANVGTRPTVGGTRTLLEVHLLDFQDDIYGRRIGVEFLTKLRDERRFDSLDALREQIAKDKERTEVFVARHHAESA